MILDDVSITPDIIQTYRDVFDNQKVKPDIEQKLFDAQSEWLLDRTNQTKYNAFYSLVYSYSQSAVLSLCENTEGMEDWEVTQVVDDTARRFLKQYTRNHLYVIGTSFWGVLILKAREARSEFLHNKKHNSISVDRVLASNGNKEVTLLDFLAKKEVQANFDCNEFDENEVFDENLKKAYDYIYVNSESPEQMAEVYKILMFSLVRYTLDISKQKINFQKFLLNVEKIQNELVSRAKENYLDYVKVEEIVLNAIKIIKGEELPSANPEQ